MVKALSRTVFVGTYRHAVDEKNRVAIPAKWRAATKGASEFFVLPDPKNCLVVMPSSAMEKMLDRAEGISIGEYARRDVLRLIGSRAHGSPCDKQGRISLTDDLKRHAGIDRDAVLIGTIMQFEVWSPERWAELDREAMQNFYEAAKTAGL